MRIKAPLAESGNGGSIKLLMADALKSLDARYSAIGSDLKREDSAAGQMLALRFERVFRPLRY
ncbi:MAG TPA: hypothetical protein VGG93_07325 [Candidatus Udaeobacter sp.]|jgi:hypothetical protein